MTPFALPLTIEGQLANSNPGSDDHQHKLYIYNGTDFTFGPLRGSVASNQFQLNGCALDLSVREAYLLSALLKISASNGRSHHDWAKAAAPSINADARIMLQLNRKLQKAGGGLYVGVQGDGSLSLQFGQPSAMRD